MVKVESIKNLLWDFVVSSYRRLLNWISYIPQSPIVYMALLSYVTIGEFSSFSEFKLFLMIGLYTHPHTLITFNGDLS